MTWNLLRFLVVAVAAVTLLAGAPVLAGDYGKCSFSSDCHKDVKCSGGRCADAAGGHCSFSSDCGWNGAKCTGGKCSNAPDGRCSFGSECPSGNCSSGKCKR